MGGSENDLPEPVGEPLADEHGDVSIQGTEMPTRIEQGHDRELRAVRPNLDVDPRVRLCATGIGVQIPGDADGESRPQALGDPE